MRICQLKICNFRGIREATISFQQHTVLLGPNNAGKTTIVEALTLLFGRERMVRAISDWDFYGGAPKPETRFYIIATITDFPFPDPVNNPDWFAGENAGCPAWWNNDTQTLSFDPDPPKGTNLAVQVAMAGRYDETVCEFEIIRYFYYGEADPFTDTYAPLPFRLLRELGVFLLSSNREWDKLLSFSSSSLLKVIREYEALPADTIETLKQQLRSGVAKPEESLPFSDILRSTVSELQSFLLIGDTGKLIYRPTSLDTFAVLQSLVAHVETSPGCIIPVARHGAGMVSLQAFLLLLAFAQKRREAGKGFVLAAEEPELHLHPSLHQRLVHRIRSASQQSLITTQSPAVAAGYQPHETLFVINQEGAIKAAPVKATPIKNIPKNSIKKLYTVHRTQLYESLMGSAIFLPEGIYDYEWFVLWQCIAQSSPDEQTLYDLKPLTFIPTSDSAVVDTYAEFQTTRPDIIPILDGDVPGDGYERSLLASNNPPAKIVRYGKGAAVECLVAWMLEPALSNPGEALQSILPASSDATLKNLQAALIDHKKDRQCRESLAWEALEVDECRKRVCELFHDLAGIAYTRTSRSPSWQQTISGSTEILIATHIAKV